MSLLALVQWIATWPWSVGIRESAYAFPVIESVHVLGLCLFVGMAVLFDLRLLGYSLQRIPVGEAAKRLLPWTTTGLVIMVVSGALTFLNDPVRYYNNVFFRGKVVLLALAALNAYIFHSTVYRSVQQWGTATVLPRRARVAGACSLVLWGLIIIAGRMIAYNWFDKK